MDLTANGQTLRELGVINVIMGKNGCGKSRLLRHFDEHLASGQPNAYVIKYLSPERGGSLTADSSIRDTIQASPGWAGGQRRKNRVENFRQISVAEFQLLELTVLRTIEKDLAKRQDATYTFDTTIETINRLLDNIKVVRHDRAAFEVQARDTTDKRDVGVLSSGESELLSVVIEILSFASQMALPTNQDRRGILLLDEPDVHLHPDLQQRLMELLASATHKKPITTIIATHSTAILGGLNNAVDAKVAFMPKGTTNLSFRPISDALRDVIPVFGAHPLSNVFNQSPVLLVEGEDDVRIWQRAVRSSQGRIKLWPCPAGDIQSLNSYETTASEIIGAVYDNARAYSLRDRDGAPYEINDLPHVTRMRLNCRTAENLLLSDDSLAILGATWDQMRDAITNWIAAQAGHPRIQEVQDFAAGWDRMSASVKEIRNILLGLTGYAGDWETAVGQAIARLDGNSPTGEGSLIRFLGEKAVQSLSLRAP